MKLRAIIESILAEKRPPKNKWIQLKGTDFSEYAEELYQIIHQTYSAIGGHPEFKSSADINNRDLNFWLAADVDTDPELDVMIAGKNTSHGLKLTTAATDGGSISKKSMIEIMKSKLMQPGNYTEASHKIAEILTRMRVPYLTDPKKIETVLKKDIEYIDDGWYYRKIGSERMRKRLFGYPN